MRPGRRLAILAGVAVLVAGALLARRASVHAWLFSLTGEENLFAQARAVGHLLGDLLRPPLDLQAEAPIAHTGVNPFGINTFLQQEVEPAKRARQVELIAAAGFHWLRQEFPWADLEIHAKGSFDDCRHPPGCVSAWDKYDQIVDLAEQAGLELLVRLSSPPDWSRADGAARGPFAPPDDFADFADYAAAVAGRYRGRVRYFQVWNEPNGNDEWGYQPVDPEAYVRLLCQTHARLKAVDPGIVVLAAALTPTNELGAANPNGLGGNNLNDLIYLQRMYAAGAQPCFDVLSVQGYGLWSGPTDQRRRPIIINFGRNEFIRDLMVANGDAHKAIWIAEMNWNAVPSDSGIVPNFGQVTLEQQARYAPLAYQRAQEAWPWVGMTAFWFFKRADESERGQSWYYFRMAEPDFTLLPVYAAMQAYTRQTPAVYPGFFQEDHWAIQWSTGWQAGSDPAAVLGGYRAATRVGAAASFVFQGSSLILVTHRGPEAGQLGVRLDGGPQRVHDLRAATPARPVPLTIAQGLPPGQHTVELTNLSGFNRVDGLIVRRAPSLTGAFMLVFGAALGGFWLAVRRRVTGGG